MHSPVLGGVSWRFHGSLLLWTPVQHDNLPRMISFHFPRTCLLICAVVAFALIGRKKRRRNKIRPRCWRPYYTRMVGTGSLSASLRWPFSLDQISWIGSCHILSCSYWRKAPIHLTHISWFWNLRLRWLFVSSLYNFLVSFKSNNDFICVRLPSNLMLNRKLSGCQWWAQFCWTSFPQRNCEVSGNWYVENRCMSGVHTL